MQIINYREASLFNHFVLGSRYSSAVGFRSPGAARHQGDSLASSSNPAARLALRSQMLFRKTCTFAHISPMFSAACWYYWIHCRQQLQYFQNIKRGLIVAFQSFDPAIKKLRRDRVHVLQHYIAQHFSQPVVTEEHK
jgi:hypothetical protein